MEVGAVAERNRRLDRKLSAPGAPQPDQMRAAAVLSPYVMRQAAGVSSCSADEFELHLVGFDSQQPQRLDRDFLCGDTQVYPFTRVRIHGFPVYLLCGVGGEC